MRIRKSLRLLGLLGMLGLGLPVASAQTVHGVRVGLTQEGPSFIVDGQQYSQTQYFLWPDNSVHIIQFPQVVDPNGDQFQVFQFFNNGQSRVTFNGWTSDGLLAAFPLPGAVSVTVTPKLTQVLGTLVTENRVLLSFDDYTEDTAPCTKTLESQLRREGVIVVDTTACYNNSTYLWLQAGEHSFQTYAYPGFGLGGLYINGVLQPFTNDFKLTITGPMTIRPTFVRAKRVRFASSPGGFQVLVDHSLLSTSPLYSVSLPGNNTGPTCPVDQMLPVITPVSVPPLCVGDFDFIPGTTHQLAAPDRQQDVNHRVWVFDHFSNGLGQNSNYVVPDTVDTTDVITAVFAPGVAFYAMPSEPYLRIDVDGGDNKVVPYYYAIFGEGQKHHVSAPLTQTDSKGRVWKFVSWSDGGAAEHDVVMPTNTPPSAQFILNATFAVQGQIKVTSTPTGMTVTANGNSCTTPCSYDDASGKTLHLVAAQSVPNGDSSRFDLDGWTGRPAGTTTDVTFTGDVQTVNVQYHKSHHLTALADPQGGATFTFNPTSTDGYYTEGTAVQVTVTTKPGFKFQKWAGDLLSKLTTDTVQMTGSRIVVADLGKTPVISPAGIQSAAGDNPNHTVAPGSIISIYGQNLADGTEIGPNNPLSQTLANVYVTVNSSILPLIFVSPAQINAELPSGFSDGDYTLVVHTPTLDINGPMKVKRNSPGIFFVPDTDGTPIIAALHADGSLITKASPAKRGETITFFGTGISPYTLPAIDGFPLPPSPVYTLADTAKLLVQTPAPSPLPPGTPAPVPVTRDLKSAVGAAGMVGVTTLTFTVDTALPAGNSLEIYLSVPQKVGNVTEPNEGNRVRLPVQ